jgi:protocatechuate 3,4-dioxygenase beta subunit
MDRYLLVGDVDKEYSMTKHKKISRRDVTKQIGLAAGISLLALGVTRATAPTPEQVEGPFYPIDEQADKDMDLTLIEGHSETAEGEKILVRGRVSDANGRPLHDALVDVWQANHFGRYSHPEDKSTAPLDVNFQGWGVTKTNAEGRYGLKTIKPGAYRLSAVAGSGQRCRHIHFKVSRPGFKDLTTQMYFQGDPLIDQDLVMAETPTELRHLLIANLITDEVTRLPLYRFDLVLVDVDA